MTACGFGRWKCAERTIDEEGTVTAGLAIASPFCPTCDDNLRDALTDLPVIRFELMVTARKTYSGFGSQIHADIPIDVELDAIGTKLDHAVLAWSYAVGEAQRLVELTSFKDAARRLANHVETLYNLPETRMSRWVEATHVVDVPEDVYGLVKASGEARVIIPMDGVAGCVELYNLWCAADLLLSRRTA